jgi:hypothetical protein
MNQKIFGTMKQKNKLNTLKDIFSLHNGLKYIGRYIPFGPIFKKMYEITVPQLSLEILKTTLRIGPN